MEKIVPWNNETLADECTENLMLISALGEQPYRHLAFAELRKRRLINSADQFIDGFMTNLSVVC
jgi:hypothetical protein